MKNLIKSVSVLFVVLFFSITLNSCSDDDDGLTMIYSYTTKSDSNLTIINNTDDATKMQNLFLDKKWFTTKNFSGNTIEETDAKAKAYFDQVIDQANASFAKMALNGNCKFTYKCTRSNTTTDAKIEIAKMEWKYLKTKK